MNTYRESAFSIPGDMESRWPFELPPMLETSLSPVNEETVHK